MKRMFSCLTLVIFIVSQTGIPLQANATANKIDKEKKSETTLFTLTVTSNDKAVKKPGDDLLYNILLMNLLGPVANVQVKINDPFDRVCTSITTGPDGRCVWLKQITQNAKPQIYVIEFYYENTKQYSKVVVSVETAAIELPSYPVNLKISNTLDAHTLLLANKGGFQNNIPDIKSVLKEGVKFGYAVAKDYLSNPGNALTVIVAIASCTAGHASGATPLCVASVKSIIKDVALISAKQIGYKIIDASYSSEEERNYYKTLLSLSTTSLSIISIDPAEGIVSSIDALSEEYDFFSDANNLPVILNGKSKGAACAAQRKGRNELVILSMYNSGEQASPSLSKSKDSINCDNNYTGDYSFQNNTDLNLEITLNSSPSKKRAYTSPFVCTIKPGHKQRFYNVSAGPARYEIKKETFVSGSNIGSTRTTPFPKNYYSNGQFYVDVCKETTFFISIDSPSYASNNRSLPITGQNNPSKDKNCKENDTGDYCFYNTTEQQLEITLNSSPSKKLAYISPFTCTIQPGQKQWFYDIPAGPAWYEIRSGSFINGYNQNLNTVPKNYYERAQLYVDPCQANLFVIK